jgi:CHASE3 domain sensor protein
MVQSLRLKNSIMLGYTIPLILLVLLTGLIYFRVTQLQRQNTLLGESTQMVESVNRATYGVAVMQRAARGYLLNSSEKSLQDYKRGEANYLAGMAVLEKLVKDPQQVDTLDKVKELSEKVRRETETYLSLAMAGKAEEAVQKFREGATTDWALQLDQFLNDFGKTENSISEERRAGQESSLNAIPSTLLSGVLLAMVLATILGFWVASRISETIRKAVNTASTTSNEIATTIVEQERTANQQAAMVSETTATMEELSVSSRQTTEQAAATATLAQNSSTLTMEGNTAVRQAITAMEELKTRISGVGGQILALSEQTGQIGIIAELVKDLSMQINMLSLNAAVEAARAGEHGKGFAVVAGEVRKLSVESRKSAEQAKAIVAAIQKATDVAIMKTEEGSRTVESVSAIAQTLEGLFQSLSEAAEQFYQNSQQVVLNTKQQSTAIAQVVEAANSINAGARETAAGISQTKIGIQNLNSATEQLLNIV